MLSITQCTHLNKGGVLKLSILFFVLLFGSSILSAQQFEWMDHELVPSILQGIFEREDRVYGIIANALDDTTHENHVYRLDRLQLDITGGGQSGFKINERSSWDAGPFFVTRASQYISKIDAWLFLQTSILGEGHHIYRLLLQDHDFNILENRVIDTLGYPATFTFACNDETCHMLGYLIGPPRHEFLYARCDFNRSPILSDLYVGQSEPQPGGWVTGMAITDDKNLVTFSPAGITIMDSMLHIIENYPYAVVTTSGHGDIQRTQEYFYSIGQSVLPPYNGYRRLLLQQYDKEFNIIKNDTLGQIESDNYPFIRRSLCIRDNEIIVGGHLDGPYNGGNIWLREKKFFIAKYDLYLKKIWYKEYGGDRAYWLSGLEALSDGSIMIYGNIMDTILQQQHAYLLHIDQDGEILNTNTTTLEAENKVKVISTGGNKVLVQNYELTDADIIFFTLTGHIVYKTGIEEEMQEFDLSHLPPGYYVYLILQNEKPVTSGKWLKAQ